MDTKDLILERLQRLLCLGLERQPASELIAGTAQIWQEHFGRYEAYRIADAFDAIESTAKTWPTIASIREAIPSKRAVQSDSIRIAVDPEQAERNRKRVAEMVEKLVASFL